jgi:CheY-like chemotaxis protein
LVVDDEPAIRDLAKDYLEEAGDYRIRPAGSTVDTLNAMANEAFDVVFESGSE